MPSLSALESRLADLGVTGLRLRKLSDTWEGSVEYDNSRGRRCCLFYPSPSDEKPTTLDALLTSMVERVKETRA